MTVKKNVRKNYYYSILFSFGIAIIVIIVSLIMGGSIDALSILPESATSQTLSVLTIPIFLNRFFLAGSSYIGRMFDIILGKNRTLWSLKTKPEREDSCSKEKYLTIASLIASIFFASALVALGAALPLLFLGSSVFSGILLSMVIIGMVTGLFARTGRLADYLKNNSNQDKQKEMRLIGVGWLLGLITVIGAGIKANWAGLITIAGAFSCTPLVAFICIPIIIGMVVGGCSYIGKCIDALSSKPSTQSYWNYFCEIENEKKGVILGVPFGLILGITLAILIPSSILLGGVPLVFALVPFIMGATAAVAGLFARIGVMIDYHIASKSADTHQITSSEDFVESPQREMGKPEEMQLLIDKGISNSSEAVITKPTQVKISCWDRFFQYFKNPPTKIEQAEVTMEQSSIQAAP